MKFAVFFSGSLGDGIEMVEDLNEAHAIDSVQAIHSDAAYLKAVPAALIEGLNRPRLLLAWLDSL